MGNYKWLYPHSVCVKKGWGYVYMIVSKFVTKSDLCKTFDKISE